MTSQQLYSVGLVRGGRRVYFAGPLPTPAKADAWMRDARANAVVLPWPQHRFSEDLDMPRTVTRSERPATFDDLLDVPEHLIGEIIDGRLVTHPRPVPKHAYATTRLALILGPAFEDGIDGPGGWTFVFEPRLRLGPHTKVPDIAAWREERMPEIPDIAYFDIVPDWACEFISPSTEMDDRMRKPEVYAEFGISYYWLGNSMTRTLETFVLDRGKWDATGKFRDNDTVAAPPFHEAPFSLGRLWKRHAIGKT